MGLSLWLVHGSGKEIPDCYDATVYEREGFADGRGGQGLEENRAARRSPV
ncbi:hypothetical protein GCM10007071_22800 [Marinobacter zhanjiangensis]|uniref:Uncharacterized protein n=1 Tax=Marinobacter zhanjiangensis TaxID=578215 RepID=A0ABQ3B5R8_9GAMM|nr:hypothetical protein GCM10007071_22800 [Marinobacter zhanjiangensis]